MASAIVDSDAGQQLVEKLNAFLAMRLCLILLPVRTRLKDLGYEDLAEAVKVAVGNIQPNLSGIVSDYQVRFKRMEHRTDA